MDAKSKSSLSLMFFIKVLDMVFRFFIRVGDDVEDNMYLVEASMESGDSIDDTLTSENQEKFLKESMESLSARA